MHCYDRMLHSDMPEDLRTRETRLFELQSTPPCKVELLECTQGLSIAVGDVVQVAPPGQRDTFPCTLVVATFVYRRTDGTRFQVRVQPLAHQSLGVV